MFLNYGSFPTNHAKLGEFTLHPMVHLKDAESVPVDLCVDVLYVLPKLNYDSRIG